MTYQEVIEELHALANPEKVQFKKEKFGIITSDALGVYHADLKILAKKIGADNELALKLFDSGIFEGRLLCSKIFKPKDITEALMETWLVTFENWEICDSFSMGLFSKSPFAVKKIREWSTREREFEKRAAFATLSSYCMADKKSENELFLSFLPIIEREATDERLYVKKAVNWALRSIGKRNIDLNKAAIGLSRELLKKESKVSKWIAKDALRELEKEGANILDYPRAIYRT
ncbi:DNA alkylation repair protein [Arcticibacterium luteifluviistationis]|uniref:DNA alkylation repair protein n=1 Tax=Arcticibacterium luteifluviistationis TaxID=1784714 RepID=A0A2Z4GDE2_9BACT|nr:DNA alkylation repair protein [Arcticibacterium luteifluviistationis]AWV99329.1 DNA alkylation repair protein [Arcticibacterium luteifluviistationis]